MSEYICREKLIEKLNDDINRCYMLGIGCVGPIADLIDTVNEQPSVDVRLVVRGKNITEMRPVDEFICSECGIDIVDFCRYEPEEDCAYEYEFKFCPNCGAKMDLED